MEMYIGIYIVSAVLCLGLTAYEFWVTDTVDIKVGDYCYKVFHSLVPVLNTLILVIGFIAQFILVFFKLNKKIKTKKITRS